MTPERVWTNSALGRVICTAYGVVTIGMLVGTSVGAGTPWSAGRLFGAAAIVVVGVAVPTAAWTSRLVLADGVLTATNFGISRSMPLAEVIDVDPATFPFLGMKARRVDRSGIRTLVSGRSWEEWWTPRAEKIAREIEVLAADTRAASRRSSPSSSVGWE